MKVFPNPFQQSTTVCIFLEKNADVTLEVFNLLGQKVKTILQNQNQTEGKHQYLFSGNSEGIYLVKLTVNEISSAQKIIHAK
ncbi:MAG: T9SS type A sorting domain-containing protein [Chitinophagaceae bacterium]|nr:T9SS type A sorting domain-containing protein [Chitinophagaceae bacterium]